MRDFASVFAFQRERIIEISERVENKIAKWKNHQILAEDDGFCTKILTKCVQPDCIIVIV